MPTDAFTPATAALDPWLPVTEMDEVRGTSTSYIFGYALAHHARGGLSWMTTSPVVSIDGTRATTQSGTIYALGRKLASPDDLSDPEGQAAFRALVLRTSDEAERAWLMARKVARHLDLPLPSPAETEHFLSANSALYAARLFRTASAGTA